MPTFEEPATPREKAIALIRGEIARAENERIPTSRQKLSQLVAVNFVFPPREAATLVDEYCDAEAPGVPHYLQAEFSMPYLKVSAVVNAILGIGAAYFGAQKWHARGLSWPFFLASAVLVALAGLSLFKVIQQELAKSSG